jgi:hypothetical protein
MSACVIACEVAYPFADTTTMDLSSRRMAGKPTAGIMKDVPPIADFPHPYARVRVCARARERSGITKIPEA